MGTFTGSPPEYDIVKVPGTPSMRPPMFNFAKVFGDYLKTLIGQPAPAYGGSIDPGMSPSMQMMGVLSQMYANSPLPAAFGQAQGALSRFMAPTFTNPTARMQFGAPDYFGGGFGAQQRLPGGKMMGEIPYAGGMRPYSGFPTGGSQMGGPPMRGFEQGGEGWSRLNPPVGLGRMIPAMSSDWGPDVKMPSPGFYNPSNPGPAMSSDWGPDVKMPSPGFYNPSNTNRPAFSGGQPSPNYFLPPRY